MTPAIDGVTEQIDRIPGAGGREIVVHRFQPTGAPRGALLMLHGIQSHAGWYRETCRFLAAHGIEVACPERRGSGRDGRDRGHAASAGVLLEDAALASAALARASGQLPVWVGISWGAKLAWATAVTHPERMHKLVLVVPGLLPRIQMPGRDQLRVALFALLGGRWQVPISLEDPALFSDDPAGRRFVAEDPLALRRASAWFFLASRQLDHRIQRSYCRLDSRLPVLLVLARGDRIVDNQGTLDFVRWRAAERLELWWCEQARHTPELSGDAGRYRERLRQFCCGGTV